MATYTDTFVGRTVSNGWGTASDGTAWTNFSNPSACSVSTGEGRISSVAGGAVNTLGSSQTSGELLLRFAVQYASSKITLFARADASFQNMYTLSVSGSSCNVVVTQTTPSRFAYVIAPTSLTFTIAAGTFYWCKFSAIGNVFKVKVWQDGTSEPGAYTASGTDASMVLSSGFIGVGNAAIGAGSGDGLTVDSLSYGMPPTSFLTFGRGKFAGRAGGTNLLRSRFVLKTPVRTPLRTLDAIRTTLPIRGWERMKVSTRSIGRGQATLKTRAVLASRMRGQALVRGIHQVKAQSRSVLRGTFGQATRSIALLRTRLSALVTSRSSLRVLLWSALRQKNSLRAALRVPLRMTERLRFATRSAARALFLTIIAPIHLASQARTHLALRSPSSLRTQLIARLRAKQSVFARQRALLLDRRSTFTRTRGQVRSRVISRTKTTFVTLKTATRITLMFITFSEVAPTGYTGGIKPGTTIATQLLVTDQNSLPLTGLVQCSVTITDPLGASSLYSLDTGGVVGLPGGKYWCTYNTTGEGIYTELWSLVAPDGIEIASYKNSFRVAY